MKTTALQRHYHAFRQNWLTLNVYERFEHLTALLLTALIAVLIVVAIWELLREVVRLLASGLLDPLNHSVFQVIFGQIMTVLIALEFRHSILSVVAGRGSIVQVKTVLLVGVLALSRKFIILEPSDYPPGTLFALAAILLALAATYWLLPDREIRQTVK